MRLSRTSTNMAGRSRDCTRRAVHHYIGGIMKKKPELEADLDPQGTRHTRPGGKAAESALANSKPAAPKRRGGAGSPTRPGSTAAARAVDAAKGKRSGGK
jgi:hypothetical protein